MIKLTKRDVLMDANRFAFEFDNLPKWRQKLITITMPPVLEANFYYLLSAVYKERSAAVDKLTAAALAFLEERA